MAETETDDPSWIKIPLTVSDDWIFMVFYRDPSKKVREEFDMANFITTLVI